MYEINVLACNDGEFYTKYICDYMNETVIRYDASNVCAEKGSTYNYCVACDNKNAKHIKKQLHSAVCNVLSLGYKHRYFSERLHLTRNIKSNALINLMCLFDNNNEKQLISKHIDCPTIHLDATYNFRLRQLASRWEEVTMLTTSYGDILYDSQTLLEFLRFLLRSVPYATDSLTVSFDGQFYLTDAQKNAHCNLMTLPIPNSTIEDNMIFNLICHRPKTLTLGEGTAQMSNDCKKLCRYLFN